MPARRTFHTGLVPIAGEYVIFHGIIKNQTFITGTQPQPARWCFQKRIDEYTKLVARVSCHRVTNQIKL